MLFVKLMMKFVNLKTRLGKGSFSRGSNGVDPAAPAGDVPGFRFQEAAAFHAVEKRVEGSGSDAVAVVFEFFHHRKAEDAVVKGVHEDVDADQPGKQIAMMRLRGQRIPSLSSAPS